MFSDVAAKESCWCIGTKELFFSLAAAPTMNGSIVSRSEDGEDAKLTLQYSGQPEPRIFLQLAPHYKNKTEIHQLSNLTSGVPNPWYGGHYVKVTLYKYSKNTVTLKLQVYRFVEPPKLPASRIRTWAKIFVQNAFGTVHTTYTFQGRWCSCTQCTGRHFIGNLISLLL